ncbi:MAG: hypothetical protein WCA46_04130, partial [Actinocatenispora sp.]
MYEPTRPEPAAPDSTGSHGYRISPWPPNAEQSGATSQGEPHRGGPNDVEMPTARLSAGSREGELPTARLSAESRHREPVTGPSGY